MLIDYVFGAAIAIAHGDPDRGNEDDRDTACVVVVLPSQAATAPRKQHLSSQPLRGGCSDNH